MNLRKHAKTINVFVMLFFILLIIYSAYVKLDGVKLKDENKTLENQLTTANEKIKEQENELNDLKIVLEAQTDVDVDYLIEANVTDSNVAVIAIHGGKIEKGTTELAYALATQNNFNYYSFLGSKSTDNLSLRVPSDEFAEAAALHMVSKSTTTLSIHGCEGEEEFTYVGGKDTELSERIKKSLTEYGFVVKDAPKGLDGTSLDNIVNNNIYGRGVQIEISNGLRIEFLSSDKSLTDYVLAISEAFDNW
ncbi:poly-gamma-glutamate hydrolase family protein [Dehalobacterium formicoaceticum]|uniref:Poly-gamma-glutamate hydrolase family protein n=1 Tax=Dehalobacterium formicoaceticum TaxID=51515 RepID=A0ABT1Y0Y6_9FIRM|nr:poly-gamma-glutamate hydrolase family protein [Dehalobacterium formicoaceticum]MCR6544522.1 poly-gamma-glutamate hydrolase family protein [Dehalobacterium formicoaceticum]